MVAVASCSTGFRAVREVEMDLGAAQENGALELKSALVARPFRCSLGSSQSIEGHLRRLINH